MDNLGTMPLPWLLPLRILILAFTLCGAFARRSSKNDGGSNYWEHATEQTMAANSYGGSGVDLAQELRAVLDVGDTYTCQAITFTLKKKLGAGDWGDVFSTIDSKFAVKVETQQRTNDKYAHLKDFTHECTVMQALWQIRGISVPKCRALCKKDGFAVLVMDFIPNAEDMNTVKKKDTFNIHRIAEQIYESVTTMVAKKIINVDQDAKNILVSDTSKVHFVDMGMAEFERDVDVICSDETYSERYAILRDLKALGKSASCDAQKSAQYYNTLRAALSSLPESREAMEGLVDAYCRAPHAELHSREFIKVSASAGDREFKGAFLGKDRWGDAAPALFANQGGVWTKVNGTRVSVSSGERGVRETHEISEGSRLVGVRCNGQTVADLQDFDPRHLCAGTYYFEAPSVELVREAVMSSLTTSSLSDLQDRVQAC